MFILLVIFIIFSMPVSLAMILSSCAYIIIIAKDCPFDYLVIAKTVSDALDSFPMMAIPFYILAAEIMNYTTISKRLLNFCTAIVGHFKGGLAQVNVLASIIFSGLSGSSSADAAGLGAIEIKMMKEEGYEPAFAAAVTVVSSTLGPIIPPSILMVVYGVTAKVSVGRLFAAGLIPGLVLGLMMMFTVYVLAKKGSIKGKIQSRKSFKDVLKTTINTIPILLIPVILLGGIFSGKFTPTEGGAIAVLYAIVLGFIYGDLKWDIKILDIFRNAVITTAKIGFLISSAAIFGWVVIRERIGVLAYQYIESLGMPNWAIILFIIFFLFIAGLFIEGVAIIMITVPVVVPILPKIGLHPVTFGVLLVLTVMVGFLTPPVGVGTYIVTSIAQAPLDRVLKFSIPFFISFFIGLLLISYVPIITLYLPLLFFG